MDTDTKAAILVGIWYLQFQAMWFSWLLGKL